MPFFRRQWFHRIWVLQEIRFAREAVIICGSKAVDWSSFQAFKYWNNTMKWVKHLPYVIQWSLVRYSRGNVNNEFLSAYPKRLHRKLKLTRHIGATDPRDKVFAILPLPDWEEAKFWEQKSARLRSEVESESSEADGEDDDQNLNAIQAQNKKERNKELVRHAYEEDVSWTKQETQGVNIKEDYGTPAAELFTQLAMDLINVLGLSVLSDISSPVAMTGLPSWAPDWNANNKDQSVGRSRRAERQLAHTT
ncbi:uncharacterized protein PV09_02909 [Verruconis gallopava]|uniref:Heterokaryon incompatibility domain-containing protein n=1 Tax=Verruconis gallopava TaxID=253628 RepID=A0A0D2AIV6_9PEZI|nr:uncharacterized protein PV09_02909 [Verruconis gallopava]KIW06470.1 hypothetical protein PV09_02909 [Verruconis gallopava]